ncbi:MAG: hypothetical protein CVV06_09090 [Gammaproteobacteria bacterium HGW-Gammaproteobacteria-10]|nr:MAG: hypothetical protein CVV06_09090 [Gammaproteobacteria bacterium HGW-Gammaproteobacteria-10]
MSIGIIFQTMERTGRMDELVQFSLTGQSVLILLGHLESRTGYRSLSGRLVMITGCSVWMVQEACETNISCLIAPKGFSQPPAFSLSQATTLVRDNNYPELMVLRAYFAPSVIRHEEHDDLIRGEEEASFENIISRIDDTYGTMVNPALEESSNAAHAILCRSEEYQAPDSCDQAFPGANQHYGGFLNNRFWKPPNPKTN